MRKLYESEDIINLRLREGWEAERGTVTLYAPEWRRLGYKMACAARRARTRHLHDTLVDWRKVATI